MNILLNDLITLSADPNGGDYIITDVQGLGAADIRTSSFLFSGRSGGLVTDQFYGFRTIAITGKIGNNVITKQEQKDARAALQAAIPIGTTFPIEITVFSGETYQIDVNLTDLKLEYNQRGHTSDFLIQLTAGDPLFYSTDGGDEQSAELTRVAQGGYVTPYILPVEWDSGSSPTIVVNGGSEIYYPVITLNDAALNPSVQNQATGEIFELDLSMVDGDELVIDMLNRTVNLNGASVMGNKTPESVWWGLVVGNNPLVLDSDSGSDTVTGTVVWRNGILGI